MMRFLEKADILKLLDACEGIILWQIVRSPEPAPVASGIAAALVAKEGSEGEEEVEKLEDDDTLHEGRRIKYSPKCQM